MFSILFWILLNFGISWFNAYSVGMYWSESKQIKGALRFSAVLGYILSIVGFTMVYGYILLLLFPYVAPLLIKLSQDDIVQITKLSSDLLFLLIGTAIIPIGILVWFETAVAFWKRKSVSNGITLGWNTYANVKNIVTYSREAPSAIGRCFEILFGGKGKKKDNTIIVLLAIFIIILALLGGYFTASAILKKADRKYDAFEKINQF